MKIFLIFDKNYLFLVPGPGKASGRGNGEVHFRLVVNSILQVYPGLSVFNSNFLQAKHFFSKITSTNYLWHIFS